MFIVVVCGLCLFHVAGWCNFKILVAGAASFCHVTGPFFCETSARKFCFPCDSCGFINGWFIIIDIMVNSWVPGQPSSICCFA